MLGVDAETQAVIDAGNMAFSTSRAQPADTSNITEMPDGAQLVGPTTFSITAYHGTPYQVDRFRMGKIGTGEGAQAYGWGLYFAEMRKVAEEYSNMRATPDMVMRANGETLKGLEKSLAETFFSEGKPAAQIAARMNGAEWQAAWDRIKDKTLTRGNLYTVELLPDEADFLDWDKPLSEQSEKVRAALGNLPEWQEASRFVKEREEQPNQAGVFYFELSKGFESAREASERLASLGIPGIRYLDGSSRAAGEGTSNYVIFDESLVKILEENGQKAETNPGPEVEQGAPAPAPDWDLFDPSKQDSDSETIKWKETSF
jgi:hypothetical protein